MVFDLFRKIFHGNEKDFFIYILLMPYALTSLFFIKTIEHPVADAQEHLVTIYCFIFFFLPWFIFWMMLDFYVARKNSSSFKLFHSLLCHLIFASVCAFFGFGHILALNVMFGDGEAHHVGGVVVEKRIYNARWAGLVREVTVNTVSGRIKFNLPEREYNNINMREKYGQTLKLGGLGFYYRQI